MKTETAVMFVKNVPAPSVAEMFVILPAVKTDRFVRIGITVFAVMSARKFIMIEIHSGDVVPVKRVSTPVAVRGKDALLRDFVVKKGKMPIQMQTMLSDAVL